MRPAGPRETKSTIGPRSSRSHAPFYTPTDERKRSRRNDGSFSQQSIPNRHLADDESGRVAMSR